MADINIFDNINENEWLNPTVEDTELERFEFATYCFAARKNIKYQEGAILEVPEIQIDGQPFTRNNLTEGGNSKAYFLKVTGYKENGEPYTYGEILFARPKIKKTQTEIDRMLPFFISATQQKVLDEKGEIYLSLWTNFYQTEIGKLAPSSRREIGMGKPFHAKVELINYNKRPKIDKETGEEILDDQGNPEFWFDNYRANWQLFDTVEELKAAKEEYWADSNNKESSELDFTYPKAWAEDLRDVLDALRNLQAEGKSLSEIAKAAAFIDHQGQMQKDDAGNPVNWKAILAHTLDIPEALILIELK